MGGPILRDRAWLWGSAARSVVNRGVIGFYTAACLAPDGTPVAGAAYRAGCMNADVTTVSTADLKLQWRWTPAHRTTVLWGVADRQRPSRGASAFDRPEHTNRQEDVSFIQPVQIRHQWTVSDRLVLDGAFAFSDGRFVLDFHDPGLADVQGAYDRYTLVNSRSGVRTEYSRPKTEVEAAGRFFSSGVLGGRSLHVVRSRVPRRTAPAVGPDRRRRRGGLRQPSGHAGPLSGPDRPRRHRQPRRAPMLGVPGGVVSEGTREPRCRNPVRPAGRRGARDHDPGESGSPGPAAGRALQRSRFRRRVQRCRSPARAGVGRHGRGAHGAQGNSRPALGRRQHVVCAAATDGPDAAGLLVERREPGRLRAVRRTRSPARPGRHSVTQLRPCEPGVGQVACHGGFRAWRTTSPTS